MITIKGKRLVGRVLLVAGLVLTLGACSNLRIYSEARDKQGTAAQEAWKTVDLSTLVSTERANLSRLLEVEIQTQDQLASGIRDHALRAMVSGTGTLEEQVLEPAKTRIDRLVGPGVDFSEIEGKIETIRTNEMLMRGAQGDLRAYGLKARVPDCEEVNEAPMEAFAKAVQEMPNPIRKRMAEEELNQFKALCARPMDPIPVYERLGGDIKEALQQHRDDLTAIASVRTAAKAQKAEFEQAKKAYEDVLKSTVNKSTYQQDVSAAAARLKAATEALANAEDASSIELVASARLEAIDNFLTAVAETKPGTSPPPDTSKAALALILLPGFIDDARSALADSRKPLVMPLLMRRNYEELRLEGAKREIAARQSMAVLSRQIVDATYDEAQELSRIVNIVNGNLKDLKTTRLSDAFANAKGDARVSMYDAVARYLDTLRRMESRRYKLEYMRIAASHELALAYSEVNLKQWQSLIDVTVQQAAEFGASGIKSEQIVGLLNAAGVLWIGAGVN